MQISVIIPTYNRAKTLDECLEALSKQDLPSNDFEVIIVDDGSKDDTSGIVESYNGRIVNLAYYKQKNQGQGIARNLGISHAKGNIVIFIGDDIIVKKDFLTEHLRYHLKHDKENEAVLGFTAWHPKLRITPFMKWLTNGSSILGRFGGHQFAYEKLDNKETADYNFFYTSNISLKRSLISKFPFDPVFSGYGWEDIELGYRLYKRVGLIIYYNKQAIGYHDHEMQEDSLEKRMKQIGESAIIIDRKYPELKKVPPVWKKIIFVLISSDFSLVLLKFIRYLTQGRVFSLYYYALSKKYFLEGIKNKKL